MTRTEKLRMAAVTLAEDYTVSLLACETGWVVTIAHPSAGGREYDAADGSTVDEALIDACRLIMDLRGDGLIPAFPEVSS